MIIIFFIVIMTYPIKARGKFHVDLNNNVGFVVFKVGFIKITSVKMEINKKAEIKIEKEKCKNRKHRNKDLFFNYIICLIKKVRLKRIDLFCEIGNKNNAKFTALTCGYINSIVFPIIAILLNRYQNLKVFYRLDVKFEQDCLEGSGLGVITFTLLNMLQSIICAYIKIKRKRRV